MGPTRMILDKPVIAAIEGYAVAGGLELALWCDLRVAGRGATLGVFNRRFGVPLIDLGTIRLPRMLGEGRALDLILTGRPVPSAEALQIGLVQRLGPARRRGATRAGQPLRSPRHHAAAGGIALSVATSQRAQPDQDGRPPRHRRGRNDQAAGPARAQAAHRAAREP